MAIGSNPASRKLFIACMGAIYVCAFASLYTQIPGECDLLIKQRENNRIYRRLVRDTRINTSTQRDHDATL